MATWSRTAAPCPKTAFTACLPSSVSLLSEGLHRGDCAIALRALNDMLQNIAAVTHSLAFFRFLLFELLATLIRQANSLHLPLSKTSIQHLITITSPEEFSQQATQIVSRAVRNYAPAHQRGGFLS